MCSCWFSCRRDLSPCAANTAYLHGVWTNTWDFPILPCESKAGRDDAAVLWTLCQHAPGDLERFPKCPCCGNHLWQYLTVFAAENMEPWQLEGGVSIPPLPQLARPLPSPPSSLAVLVEHSLCAHLQHPNLMLGTSPTHPVPVSDFGQLAGPCVVLAEAGACISSRQQHGNPGGGRFLRQSYLLKCLRLGICRRGRATRPLLSDLRCIWLENVWFCSRLGAIWSVPKDAV